MMGKRRLSIDRLRLNVVLYCEDDPEDNIIGELAPQDLGTGPGVAFVVGSESACEKVGNGFLSRCET